MSANHTTAYPSQPQPQLSKAEWTAYERITKRLHRVQGDARRARKHGDAKKLGSAERSLAATEAALKEFLAPKVEHLWAPTRIIAKFEGHWHGVSGNGVHRHECEMVLDQRELSGPHYQTVRVLKDEEAPPTNARSAPTSMGVAWSAIAEQIRRGQIVVISDQEPS